MGILDLILSKSRKRGRDASSSSGTDDGPRFSDYIFEHLRRRSKEKAAENEKRLYGKLDIELKKAAAIMKTGDKSNAWREYFRNYFIYNDANNGNPIKDDGAASAMLCAWLSDGDVERVLRLSKTHNYIIVDRIGGFMSGISTLYSESDDKIFLSRWAINAKNIIHENLHRYLYMNPHPCFDVEDGHCAHFYDIMKGTLHPHGYLRAISARLKGKDAGYK